MRALGFLLRLLTAVVLAAALFVGGFYVDHEWNQAAASKCSYPEYRPREAAGADGYVIQWDWTEFGYVCTYDAPGNPKKRIGISDVF